MAITLISEPQLYQPVKNPIQFVFSSDNTGLCDFRYVLDIYVNGAFIIRVNELPNEVNGYGYFNIESILRNYISYDRLPNIIGFVSMPNSIISYNVEVLERYNSDTTSCIGAIVDSSILYTTPLKYAWKSSLSYLEYPIYNQDKYVISGSNVIQFSTHMPNEIKIDLDSKYNLSYLQTATPSRIEIKTYDSSNTLLRTTSILNTITNVSTPENRFISVGVGPTNLNFSPITSGTLPLISSSVDYYTVALMSGTLSTSRVSEIKKFKIDKRCRKYKKKTLFWLNRLGGFDTYTFKLNYTRQVDIQRTSYTKLLKKDYKIGDRGNTILNVDAQENYTFNSDWMSEKEAKWMEELWTSPEVYLGMDTTDVYNIIGNIGCSGSLASILLQDPVSGSIGYHLPDGTLFKTANGVYGRVITADGFANITSLSCLGVYGNSISTITNTNLIPLIITSNPFIEKRKDSIKNINYTIEATTAFKINIEGQ